MSVDQTPAVPFALWLRPPRNASLFGVIAGRTVGNVFFRVTGLGLTFMLSIVLARALRSEQYGVYVLCMTWTTLLGTLATLGLPSVAMRGTARARANGDYRAIWSLAVFT
jgi:O-antigen/teichoic acid export membrane protein